MRLWKKRQPQPETPIDPVLRLTQEVLWTQDKLDDVLAGQEAYCTALKALITAMKVLGKRVGRLENEYLNTMGVPPSDESQTLEIE